MKKMDKLNELANERPSITPVKLFEEKQPIDESTRAQEHKSTHESTRAQEHKSTDTLARENLINPIKISNFKKYFEDKLDKDKMSRLSFWMSKEHSKTLKRIKYKIFDITGVDPETSEIMRFILDEGLPKFEKMLDRESEQTD